MSKRPPVRSVEKVKPPAPPSRIFDKREQRDYELHELLGEVYYGINLKGGFARCYRVTIASTNLAVKIVWKASLTSKKQTLKLLSEIKIHQALDHPNIVKFKNAFEDDENVYMIMELCENRTFVDLIKKRRRITEDENKYWMWQLLDGVRYMHRKGYIHRDIKLGNLFLDSEMKLKIGDFGLAAAIEHDGERKKTICGTPNYIAPEILFDTKNGHSYEVDIWSLGVVMYTFLIGKPPFQTKDVKAIYKNIRDNLYDFPEAIQISKEARLIITSLLHTKPGLIFLIVESRPSIDDVMDHIYFKPELLPKRIPVSALTSIPIFESESELIIPTQRLLLSPRPTMTTPDPVNSPRSPLVVRARLPLSHSPRQLPRALPVQSPRSLTNSLRPVESQSPREKLRRTAEPLSERRENSSWNSTQASSPLPEVSVVAKEPSLRDLYNTICSGLERTRIESLNLQLSLLDLKKALVDPTVFITKWIDYTNKYGLSYQLRDGSVGVYFNDGTSIILASDGIYFEYLYYDRGGDKSIVLKREHSLKEPPIDLSKKITLLKHFKGYMQDNLTKAFSTTVKEGRQSDSKVGMDYLVKYLRTKNGVIFRLSNNSIQVTLNLIDSLTCLIIRSLL